MITGYAIPSNELEFRIYINSYKYTLLSQCKDFNLLVEHFTDEELNRFEWEINKYDRGGNITTIVCWYEGSIGTSELIAMLKEE